MINSKLHDYPYHDYMKKREREREKERERESRFDICRSSTIIPQSVLEETKEKRKIGVRINEITKNEKVSNFMIILDLTISSTIYNDLSTYF